MTKTVSRSVCVGLQGLAFIVVLLLHAHVSSGQGLREEFSSNPVLAGQFIQATNGTESRFIWNPITQDLTATLDVDQSPAFYLSKLFSPLTESIDSSFSVNFRVESIDDQFTPTGFIGLVTDVHVEDFGDGLTMLISSDRGRLTARANIDANDFRSAGSTIPLELQRDYLAVGRYKAGSRQFVVEIYDGLPFTNLVGFSYTTLPAGRAFRVDRIGLQNGGEEDFDRSAGSINVTVDNLFTPGGNPNGLSIGDASVTEGNTGTVSAVFTVRLFPASSQAVSVDYFTTDGTAKAAFDYVATAGTISFPPGIATATISVPVIGDLLDEDDGVFFVDLTNAVDSTIVRSQAAGTILDNDLPPTISILDSSVIEGDLGATNSVVLTLSLSSPSARPISVGV